MGIPGSGHGLAFKKRAAVTAQQTRGLQLVFGLALISIVAWFVEDFPILRIWFAAGFVFYAVLLWRWPWLWLIVIPALMPLLDTSPWSGRFFFDEFDALVLLTVGVLALRGGATELPAPISRPTRWVLALLLISCVCSAAIRLVPLPPITPDSFADYFSPFNALRVAKGFFWALLLLGPLRHALARKPSARLLLCTGFILGLAGVSMAALYERWLFAGIWTLATDYRITASFWSMHTGSGQIDVWLATTIPMLGILLMPRSRWSTAPLSLCLLAGALYALFATQSRGAAIALVMACAIGMFSAFAVRSGRPRTVGAIMAAFIVSVLLVSVTSSGFAETSFGQRFEEVGPDAKMRLDHWRNALALRDHTAAAAIFGMGLGSFPIIHHLRDTVEPRTAWYSFAGDGTGTFLRLWSGENLYMGQALPAIPHRDYRIAIQTRTAEPDAMLNIAWCELWLLTSQNCTSRSFHLTPDAKRWTVVSGKIHLDATGSPKDLLGFKVQPPTRFTFFVSNAPQQGVEIGSVTVLDARGRQLVQNPAFRQGADHWFWAEDNHWPWHVENLGVDLLFSQGWFGVTAIASLLFITARTLGLGVLNRDPLSPIFIAALTGYVITGMTVSPFDQPRLEMMFYLLCFTILCGFRPRRYEILAPENPAAVSGGTRPINERQPALRGI